jgi:hypothetical protein
MTRNGWTWIASCSVWLAVGSVAVADDSRWPATAVPADHAAIADSQEGTAPNRLGDPGKQSLVDSTCFDDRPQPGPGFSATDGIDPAPATFPQIEIGPVSENLTGGLVSGLRDSVGEGRIESAAWARIKLHDDL